MPFRYHCPLYLFITYLEAKSALRVIITISASVRVTAPIFSCSCDYTYRFVSIAKMGGQNALRVIITYRVKSIA